MKKLLALLMTFGLVCSLTFSTVGCKNEGKKVEEKKKTTTETTTDPTGTKKVTEEKTEKKTESDTKK